MNTYFDSSMDSAKTVWKDSKKYSLSVFMSQSNEILFYVHFLVYSEWQQSLSKFLTQLIQG